MLRKQYKKCACSAFLFEKVDSIITIGDVVERIR